MCTCSHPTPAHTYTHSRCLHTSTLIPCLGTVGCPIYPCSHGQWGLSSPTCAPAAPHCLPTNAELVRKHFSLKDKNCAKISLMIPAPHKCKHVSTLQQYQNFGVPCVWPESFTGVKLSLVLWCQGTLVTGAHQITQEKFPFCISKEFSI